MAEYVAKRDRNRCPTHPGELLREDVIPATGKTSERFFKSLVVMPMRFEQSIIIDRRR